MLRALLRPSAALVAAAALALPLAGPAGGSASAAPTPARTLVEGTPEVGECHDLDIDEAYAKADPDPAVLCTEHHTTITVGVIQFDTAPDWNDLESYGQKVYAGCTRKLASYFDDRFKTILMSAYSFYWFMPTVAQREDGASWVRCDAALLTPNAMPALPTDGTPLLGDLPLDDWAARCTKSEKDGYWPRTPCSRSHAYRARYAIKYSGSWPGTEAANRWALRKCRAKFGDRPFLWSMAGKTSFKIGFRYAVCSQKTTN